VILLVTIIFSIPFIRGDMSFSQSMLTKRVWNYFADQKAVQRINEPDAFAPGSKAWKQSAKPVQTQSIDPETLRAPQ